MKDEIMKLALLNKFKQHSDLEKKLIDTGIKTLVEHTSNDSYWGDGGDGKGKNRLGELLMEVRNLMKSKHDVCRSRGRSSLRRSSSMNDLRRSSSMNDLHVGTKDIISHHATTYSFNSRQSHQSASRRSSSQY